LCGTKLKSYFVEIFQARGGVVGFRALFAGPTATEVKKKITGQNRHLDRCVNHNKFYVANTFADGVDGIQITECITQNTVK
jgi:hypothetical protein